MAQKNPKTRLKKGLTLLEVLLIIAFLGIIFFPILQMFSTGFLISSESEMALKAISLAEKLMEEEKNLAYSNVIAHSKAAVAGLPGFSSEIVVSEPNPNLKDVEVRVYYMVGNSELNLSLKTLVANF